ncbi:hypothetical protein ACLKA6_001951 [Drosophila palustris]
MVRLAPTTGCLLIAANAAGPVPQLQVQQLAGNSSGGAGGGGYQNGGGAYNDNAAYQHDGQRRQMENASRPENLPPNQGGNTLDLVFPESRHRKHNLNAQKECNSALAA